MSEFASITVNEVEEDDNNIEDAEYYENVNEEVKLDYTSPVPRRSTRRGYLPTSFGTYHSHLHTLEEKNKIIVE